jgi:hypothetical protein
VSTTNDPATPAPSIDTGDAITIGVEWSVAGSCFATASITARGQNRMDALANLEAALTRARQEN